MIRTDLLETLKEFLKTLPREKFDLDSWREGPYWSDAVTDEALKNDCGTKGCAMGWAATLPEFKEAGLSYTQGHIRYVNPDDGKGLNWGFGACKNIFGFNHSNTSKVLFLKRNYVDNCEKYVEAQAVVRRIEYLLKLAELPEGAEMSESDKNNHHLKAEVQLIMDVEHNRI
ncbi:hypothetical protein [Acinetobacter phage vB_AbaS_TCUP2199]|nr:hypothetical protein [Acinetobacter phage vB_AbaS_TCUP2199]